MTRDDCYYLGSDKSNLDTEPSKENLAQRLREYLNLRNVSLLIGNGASLPLGAPKIGDVRDIIGELKTSPYSLNNPDEQKVALSMLDVLLPKDTQLAVEPF